MPWTAGPPYTQYPTVGQLRAHLSVILNAQKKKISPVITQAVISPSLYYSLCAPVVASGILDLDIHSPSQRSACMDPQQQLCTFPTGPHLADPCLEIRNPRPRGSRIMPLGTASRRSALVCFPFPVVEQASQSKAGRRPPAAATAEYPPRTLLRKAAATTIQLRGGGGAVGSGPIVT